MTTVTEPTREALIEAVRDELEQLWSDLSTAVGSALRDGWSMQCDNLADRIVTLSRLVGPTTWEQIDVGLLLSGVYERVLRDGGIEIPPVDWDRVREVDEYIKRGVNRR